MYTTFKIIGISSYVAVALTVLLGLFGRKIFKKHHFRIHTAIGVLTLLLASAHGVYMLLQ